MSREDVIRNIMSKGRKWWPVDLLELTYSQKTGRYIELESLERRLRDVGATWMYRKDPRTREDVKVYALPERVAA